MPLACGIPLVVTAARGENRAFRLWALYTGIFVVFFALRNLADDFGPSPAFSYPIAIDRWLFGEVPTVALQARWYTGELGRLEWLALGVYCSYFIIPTLALPAIWKWLPRLFPCYVVTSVLFFLSSALVHFLVPTAPPWLAGQDGYLPPVTQLLQRALQFTMPANYTYGAHMMAGNHVAAMPSVHMGVTWLLVLALAPVNRLLGALAVTYAGLMLFAIVYGGDHYVADGLGGIALASLCWVFVLRMQSRWSVLASEL